MRPIEKKHRPISAPHSLLHLRPSSIHWLTLPVLTGLIVTSLQAQFAVEVVNYNPGTGYATEFGTGLGYTLPEAVLGEPSRETPGEFGGPVTPFSPPYLREQLLSMGVGGSLTVRLDQPATNDPLNPYGIDFLIFGGSGFVIVNGDFTGGGITDGSRFGTQESETRVSVSSDGSLFHLLDPQLAPPVESLFPTDGQGLFTRPVDPNLTADDFDQASLEWIRRLYDGSAGGTGYDLAWALDSDGNPVDPGSVHYIRIEVLSGRVEMDGFAVVAAVPEPRTWALSALGFALSWFWIRRTRHGKNTQ